jgi:hypothetical protein
MAEFAPDRIITALGVWIGEDEGVEEVVGWWSGGLYERVESVDGTVVDGGCGEVVSESDGFVAGWVGYVERVGWFEFIED